MLLTEKQVEIIHKRSIKDVQLMIQQIHQMNEDNSHSFIINEFEGFTDDDIEQMKEIYKEKFLEELHEQL